MTVCERPVRAERSWGLGLLDLGLGDLQLGPAPRYRRYSDGRTAPGGMTFPLSWIVARSRSDPA